MNYLEMVMNIMGMPIYPMIFLNEMDDAYSDNSTNNTDGDENDSMVQ